jgi:hypothetical protein
VHGVGEGLQFVDSDIGNGIGLLVVDGHKAVRSELDRLGSDGGSFVREEELRSVLIRERGSANAAASRLCPGTGDFSRSWMGLQSCSSVCGRSCNLRT